MMFEDRFRIVSVGWSLKGSVGGLPASGPGSAEAGVFRKPFKNLGRLDAVSRAVCEAIACSLGRAGLYPCEEKLDIPLFLYCEGGCCTADKEYYNDYMEHGGTSGRANLFVYTLPTSPLGEASVHFGLTGGLGFIMDSESPWTALVEAASDNLSYGGAPGRQYLLGLARDGGGIAEAAFLLVGEHAEYGTCIPDFSPGDISDFNSIKTMIQSKTLK